MVYSKKMKVQYCSYIGKMYKKLPYIKCKCKIYCKKLMYTKCKLCLWYDLMEKKDKIHNHFITKIHHLWVKQTSVPGQVKWTNTKWQNKHPHKVLREYPKKQEPDNLKENEVRKALMLDKRKILEDWLRKP